MIHLRFRLPAFCCERLQSLEFLRHVQREAGWSTRLRSYSMNAMLGDAGEISQTGFNRNNPNYVQFFKLSSIPEPSDIFTFLDEHPDSINDGYFLNKAYRRQWIDLPASYHDGAAAFAFADGHATLHRWTQPLTRQPPRPDAASLPLDIPAGETTDYEWVVARMSLTHR